MTDTLERVDVLGVSLEEHQDTSKVEELETKIKEAKGDFIRLNGKSKFGKPLLLKVTNREFDPYPEALERFKKYLSLGHEGPGHPIRGICWLTLFEEQDDGDALPVARYHWSIRGASFGDRYGSGSGSASLSKEDYNEIIMSDPDIAKADSKWFSRAASFLVDDKYQNSGLGMFMLSASIAALDALGVKRFRPTSLLNPSIGVWNKAGLIEEKAVRGERKIYEYPKGRYIDTKEALVKSAIRQSISKFL